MSICEHDASVLRCKKKSIQLKSLENDYQSKKNSETKLWTERVETVGRVLAEGVEGSKTKNTTNPRTWDFRGKKLHKNSYAKLKLTIQSEG